MFNSFKRRLPEVSIFHRPSSPPSNQALKLLRSSLSAHYPPNQPDKPPLDYNLDVVEGPPTPDQLRTIMSYLPSKIMSPSTAFLSAHYAAPAGADRPEGVNEIAKVAQENPSALKWPIVVDWNAGKASVGDIEGVKGILEHLRKRRDGEIKEDDVYQPKGCSLFPTGQGNQDMDIFR
ncbi:putative protein of unknown function (DUF1687) [Lyophyllum shimeji]|uniref:Uncharacterized protein n=1 Tax=Lyophyllum shimeji TaxID=47721 RepID=A0A9P3PZ63_LYOSH|nr:putative protein of unknown function (DUF1687) [Lyophyllum shimeji]